MLPRKLKQVLQKEFWPSFESLLTQGTEVGRPLCVFRAPGYSGDEGCRTSREGGAGACVGASSPSPLSRVSSP